MANTVIQLKYSTITTTPTSLNIAEPAYSYASNTLFIGTPDGTSAIAIGGKFYLDQQAQIFDKANAAFTAANTGGSAASYANSAFVAANSAGVYANSAFAAANAANATDATQNSNITAASSYANSAFVAANSAGAYANSSFIKANTPSYTANSAATYANAAFLQANTPSYTANSAASYANSAFTVANNAFTSANGTIVWNTANAAFTRANNSINANTGGSITGQLNVTYAPATTTGAVLNISGANTQGGTGYLDFLKATNTSGGATNPNKYFRLDSTGVLSIVNSGYTATLLTLDDSGNLALAGNVTSAGVKSSYNANRPAFRISGNGGSISATTTVAGGYMVVDYNQGSFLNTSTGIFTAPIAGLYQVNVVVRTQSNNNSGINQIIIRKTAASGGAVTTQIMVEFGVNTSMNHAGGSTIVKMAAGDTLKFDVTAGSISFDGNDSWSVAYLG